MFHYVKECFSWLPLPLEILVRTIFCIFAAIILYEVLKIIIDIFRIGKDIISGLVRLVVEYFV